MMYILKRRSNIFNVFVLQKRLKVGTNKKAYFISLPRIADVACEKELGKFKNNICCYHRLLKKFCIRRKEPVFNTAKEDKESVCSEILFKKGMNRSGDSSSTTMFSLHHSYERCSRLQKVQITESLAFRKLSRI